MSWEYGRLATEVYELGKPVGRTFPGLDYYARQLAGHAGRLPSAVSTAATPRHGRWRRSASPSSPADDAGFTDVTVTAVYRDGRPPGPGSHTWTFHAA
jgi:hypothetical protein